MRNLKWVGTFVLAVFTWLPQTNAAEVEVEWQNSDKYRDVYAGSGSNSKFKKETFAMLDKHFALLAAKLPQGYSLKVQVNDLDLAGDIHHGGMNQIRIIKDIFYPRIKFSYQLLSAQKEVVAENDVNLKDMNFMMNSSMRYSNSRLSHEKKMLDKWFSQTFSDYIAQ